MRVVGFWFLVFGFWFKFSGLNFLLGTWEVFWSRPECTCLSRRLNCVRRFIGEPRLGRTGQLTFNHAVIAQPRSG